MIAAGRNPGRQVGRFFVLGFAGHAVPKPLQEILAAHGLGGVILFGRNIASREQLRTLTGALISHSGHGHLVICTDQEGGGFQQLRPPHFTAFPAACDVREDEALDFGRRMGEELSRGGINLDLAPVLDVNSNPRNPIIGSRSFASQPDQVSRVAHSFVKGLAEQGVHACGKHFPGHGDTDQDSHVTLPTVSHPLERLRSIEFRPFLDLIREGIPFLMTAHVLYPALDARHPATFSSRILVDLLRSEMAFQGLLITDDLGMAGSLSQGDLQEACIQAFAAGCDLLLVCEHHERQPDLIEGLTEAIRKSPALQQRAEETTARAGRFWSTEER